MSKMKRSEKGLLTPDNCVVALIDHQPQMLFGVSNFDRQSIINNNVALAKAARVFEVSCGPQHGGDARASAEIIWPQIQAVFPDQVANRTLLHEFLGRQEFRCRYREDRPEKNRSGRACGPKPASRCQLSRPSTTATKSMWSKIAAATSASSRTTTR